MCYYIIVASDQPLPLRQPAKGERAFSIWPLIEDHPARRWLSKPFVVEFGARTGCACGLNFALNYEVELGIDPEFNEELTPETWKEYVLEYEADKECLVEYFAYLRTALTVSDLEWYCCWEGEWKAPPGRRLVKSPADLEKEPDFQKDYPLESGLLIEYKKNTRSLTSTSRPA
jgi:hypothetical protein